MILMFSSSQIIEVELFLPLLVFIACLGIIIISQILTIPTDTVEECIVVHSGSHKLRTKEYSWSVQTTSLWRLLNQGVTFGLFPSWFYTLQCPAIRFGGNTSTLAWNIFLSHQIETERTWFCCFSCNGKWTWNLNCRWCYFLFVLELS